MRIRTRIHPKSYSFAAGIPPEARHTFGGRQIKLTRACAHRHEQGEDDWRSPPIWLRGMELTERCFEGRPLSETLCESRHGASGRCPEDGGSCRCPRTPAGGGRAADKDKGCGIQGENVLDRIREQRGKEQVDHCGELCDGTHARNVQESGREDEVSRYEEP